MRHYRLDTTFDAVGRFWVPSRGNEAHSFAGRLAYSPGGKIRLESVQDGRSRKQTAELQSESLVHGELYDGTKVSLCDCLGSSGTTTMSAAVSGLTYSVQSALFGTHTEHIDSLRLRTVTLEPTSLRGWLGYVPWKGLHGTKAENAVEPNDALGVSVLLPDGTTSLALHACATSGFGRSSHRITADSWLQAKCAAGAAAPQLFDLAFGFFDLVELLVGAQLGLRRVGAAICNDEGEDTNVQMVWRSRAPAELADIETFEMLIPYHKIADRWQDIARSWHQFHQSHPLALVLLLKAARGTGAVIEDRLFEAMQAAEAYQQTLPRSKLMKPSEFRRAVEPLKHSVSSDLPEAVRRNLLDRIDHAIEYALPDRLRMLLERLPGQLRVRIGPNPDALIKGLCGVRNGLAHGKAGAWDKSFTAMHSHCATARVVGIVRANFLLDLGLEPTEVEHAMLRHREFRWILDQPLPCDCTEPASV